MSSYEDRGRLVVVGEAHQYGKENIMNQQLREHILYVRKTLTSVLNALDPEQMRPWACPTLRCSRRWQRRP